MCGRVCGREFVCVIIMSCPLQELHFLHNVQTRTSLRVGACLSASSQQQLVVYECIYGVY